MEHDTNIILVNFPLRVKGIVTINPDDSYTIFINSNLSYDQQKQAIKHELEHIENEHIFQQDKKISLVEHEANK